MQKGGCWLFGSWLLEIFELSLTDSRNVGECVVEVVKMLTVNDLD
jgi:hypothetical protein